MSRIYDALKRLEQVGKRQQPAGNEPFATDPTHELPVPDFNVAISDFSGAPAEAPAAKPKLPEPAFAPAPQMVIAPAPQIVSTPAAAAVAPAREPVIDVVAQADAAALQSAADLAAQAAKWSPESARKTEWRPDPSRLILFGHGREQRLASEQFRTLRSRLYQMRSLHPLKIVLVTSAAPAEGKSFVAANLAHALARQTGRRCLLVDGDLRRSTLSYYFGVAQTPGVTELMRGSATTDEVIQTGSVPGLFFAAAGAPASDPAEIVSSPKLRDWMLGLTPRFDWIVLDSPPAVAVSDASRLAEFADGVLLVVRAASTKWESAKKLKDEFKQARLLGAVLNNFQSASYYSYNYYYSAPGESGANEETAEVPELEVKA